MPVQERSSIERLDVFERHWEYAEPFVISRGAITHADGLEVQLTDSHGRRGRGESLPVDYAGETLNGMRAQIDEASTALMAGATRAQLLRWLPAGGARCALDAALWDLEAKQGGLDPFQAQGAAARPVLTAYTIGIRACAAFESAARALADTPWLKIKVDKRDPIAAIESVVRGAPRAKLIIDPNQAWTVEHLKTLAPRLLELNVGLLEQPIPVGHEAGLDGYRCPIALCADECVDGVSDLAKVIGRFDAVNIKLEKAGGLTAALLLADAATAAGLQLMVGCMGGSSLAMAPGMVLAQRCQFVDLDGPRMLSKDTEPGFSFVNGVIAEAHLPELWG